jgi:serine/threonine protein kinase
MQSLPPCAGRPCQAIQHAHQKGIIHRDIKPSNVLVALYDGKPVPKVIDFGIAKATGQQLTDHTLVTGFGTVVGTLEYMSPEQAERNQLDIDTRSDIYSLGFLLYELLTGTTPLDRKRLKEAAMLELLRLIREEEPPRPSTRLSESKDSLASVSAQRQMEPAKLTKLVRGELDWIVMKALETGALLDTLERESFDRLILNGDTINSVNLSKFSRPHWTVLERLRSWPAPANWCGCAATTITTTRPTASTATTVSASATCCRPCSACLESCCKVGGILISCLWGKEQGLSAQ